MTRTRVALRRKKTACLHIALNYRDIVTRSSRQTEIFYFREKDVVYNQQLDPIAQKVEAARLVARAMAHQWFYNVTPSWWDYQWLHEGLVIFSQTKALLNVIIYYYLEFV